ncbi:MAG: class I SAM-dependent methyltransferase [Planctomycetota bacterium]|jgi:hypothetical protein
MVKLNLGAGGATLPGYVAIDRKLGTEVYPLQYEDNSVEHGRSYDVLQHWVRKLKPGGVLKIAVPDYHNICEKYLKGEKLNVVSYLMGGQADDDDYHKSIFDKPSLTQLMQTAGCENITEWQSEIDDCAALPISLNLQGTKRHDLPPPATRRDVKIAAVMSVPRLGFIDNMFAAIRAFMPFGIKLSRCSGVFWEQCLTRLIEKAQKNGTDWLFVLDYDTWFTDAHVRRLCQLMAENPDVDALVPIQIGRCDELPLIGLRGPKGEKQTRINIKELEKPLIEIGTGHFGLTLFRLSAFSNLDKPWFIGVPDPNGGWGAGRQDPDIYFWNNFTKNGHKVCMANEVCIGHMQQMCTFPGLPKDNWKPIHLYMNKIEGDEAVGPPAHCIPRIEIKK